MGMMIIDGMHVEFTDEANVLDVIRKAGIDLPTLCYVSELSVYGACRLCTVKDDEGRYFASCTVKPPSIDERPSSIATLTVGAEYT